MSTAAVDSLHSLSLIQNDELDAWGDFKYFPTELIDKIFHKVVEGNEGPFNFARLAQTCRNFYSLCKWTVTPFPLTNCISFTRAHLNEVVKRGKLEETRQLLAHEELKSTALNEDISIFSTAIQNGQVDIVDLLLSHFSIDEMKTMASTANPLTANLLTANPLTVALQSSNTTICYRLWKIWKKEGFQIPSPERRLVWASANGHAEVLKDTLKEGACRNRDFRGCLNLAIARKQMTTAVILLTSKAVLIDSISPTFWTLGTVTLGAIAIAVASIGLTGLFIVAITFLTEGAAALSGVVFTLLILGGAYICFFTAVSAIIGVGFICHHLFVLARATALIAYYHFTQMRK